MARIYLAGKISMSGDWREQIIDLDDSDLPFTDDLSSHKFSGPLFEVIGHGCMADEGHDAISHKSEIDTYASCLEAITNSDIIFAWITDKTSYGTIFELGYAHRCLKKIIIGCKEKNAGDDAWRAKYQDLWFCFQSADAIVCAKNPRDALVAGLKEIGEYYPGMPYKQYLQTEYWKNRSEQAKNKADHSCQLCCGTGELHVHHRTYERRGYERDSDLIVLCASCHAKFHDITGVS